MTRLLLAGIALLGGMMLLGRMREGESQSPPAAVAHAPSSSSRSAVVAQASAQKQVPPAGQPAAPVASEPAAAPVSGTPSIDLLARLEGRRRLQRAASSTYFDSLFAETDSVARRWPDNVMPFGITVLPDSGKPNPNLVALVQNAIAIWQDAVPGIRFTLSSDPATAQFVVSATARAEGVRVGETHLEWAQAGMIRSAQISLARTDSTGRALPAAVALAVVVHELGHAMGLPHSPDPGDVMFPVSRVSHPSARDRATLTLLYQLPLGSVRETK